MTRYLKTLVVLVVSLMAAAGVPQDAFSQTREVGEVFRDCPHCPEMVVVPSGSFMVGSDDEGPGHRVTIGSPFAVGVHEVTRGEFGRFVSAPGRSMGNFCWTWLSAREFSGVWSWRHPGFPQTDSHPVVCVNWEDARAYVQWLSRETGESYRLLSESEWEYVARAGTVTRYWWGDDIGRNRANCDGCGSRRDDDRTTPVGSFAANRFGLFDVHGNVWEWVQDCWNDSYAGAPGDERAWERGKCSRRVLRGGSWFDPPWYLRSAYRLRVDPGVRYGSAGFRVARTLTP